MPNMFNFDDELNKEIDPITGEVLIPMQGSVDLPPTDISSLVKNAIAQKSAPPSTSATPYNDPGLLRDAQQQSAEGKLQAGLAQAGDTLANAIAGSNKGPNNQFYEDLKKQADQPVQNILQGRKAAIEDSVLKKNQETNKKQETLLDPKSSASKISQSIVMRSLKEQGIPFDPKQIEGASASELDVISNQLAKRDGLETRKAIAALGAGSREKGYAFRDEQLDKRYANQIHRTVVESLKKDKDLTQRLSQFKNLDNALSIITKAERVTPQQIHEFQQAIRGNLGIKGSSGISEREETYFKTAGLNAAAFKQFITGDPAQISQNNEIVKHLKNLANVEQQNIKNQVQQRIDALTSGYESVYEKNPAYRKDLDNVIAKSGAQFQSVNSVPKPSVTSEDKEAIEWAQANKEDPRAVKILQMHGM